MLILYRILNRRNKSLGNSIRHSAGHRIPGLAHIDGRLEDTGYQFLNFGGVFVVLEEADDGASACWAEAVRWVTDYIAQSASIYAVRAYFVC